MKKIAIVTVLIGTLAAVVACSRTAASSPAGPSLLEQSVSPNAGARLVTGTGEVTQMPGVVGRNTIDAKQATDGTVSGTLTGRILDLSGFGVEDGQATLNGRITCLEFFGDSVWFGAEIVSATDPTYVQPPLNVAIGQIRVSGGQSFMFSGPAVFYTAPGTTCVDRPTLPLAPVTKGGFNIR